MIGLIVFSLLGALFYWSRGGHGPLQKTFGSQPFKSAYALLISLVAIYLGANVWEFLAILLTTFGIVTVGHGTGLDMGRNPDYVDENEFIGELSAKVFKRGSYRQDFLTMFISGASYFVPLGIFMMFTDPLIAISVVFGGGLFKSMAYDIGWRLKPKNPIYYSELICGGLQGFLCGALVA